MRFVLQAPNKPKVKQAGFQAEVQERAAYDLDTCAHLDLGSKALQRAATPEQPQGFITEALSLKRGLRGQGRFTG